MVDGFLDVFGVFGIFWKTSPQNIRGGKELGPIFEKGWEFSPFNVFFCFFSGWASVTMGHGDAY